MAPENLHEGQISLLHNVKQQAAFNATYARTVKVETSVPRDAVLGLIFPFRDDKGHIWAVRAMDGQGRTADLGETDKNITHVIDPGGDLAREKAAYGRPVIITADCLSASVLHKDTGAPVIVVPKAGHLPTRAADIRLHHPKSRIVIATPTRNLHADQAAAVAAGELVVIDGIQAKAKIVADLAAKRPVAVDPALAKDMGAFVEDALSLEDVLSSQPKAPRKHPGKGKGGLGR